VGEVEEVSQNRSVSVNMVYEGTEMGLNYSEYINRFVGLADDQKRKENLIFSFNDKSVLKYKINIRSGMTWTIKSSEVNILDYLDIEQLTGGGTNLYESFIVSVKKDMINNPEMTPWIHSFYFEFENGDKMEFYGIQKGVFKKLDNYSRFAPSGGEILFYLTTDERIYYYELVTLGNAMWLDRYIGATTGIASPDGKANVNYGKIISLSSMANRTVKCPNGFEIAMGSNLQHSNALKYIWDNSRFIDENGMDSEGIFHDGYSKRWCISLDQFGDKFYYPNSVNVYTNTAVAHSANIFIHQSGLNSYMWVSRALILGATTPASNSYKPGFDSELSSKYMHPGTRNYNNLNQWYSTVDTYNKPEYSDGFGGPGISGMNMRGQWHLSSSTGFYDSFPIRCLRIIE